MHEIPFSDDYEKLRYDIFPTLRRRDKFGDTYDFVAILYGTQGDRDHIGDAQIIHKQKLTLSDLTPRFLQFDTNTDSMNEAKTKLNNFYRIPIGETEQITLYWLKWIRKNANWN